MDESPHNFIILTEPDKQFLISRFEDEVHQCTGKCYCSEEGEEDRRAIGQLTQTFLVLFIGSLSIGLNELSTLFDDECRKLITKLSVERFFEGVDRVQCKPEKVVSELEECTPSDDENSNDLRDGEPMTYTCKGRCTQYTSPKVIREIEYELRERFQNPNYKPEDDRLEDEDRPYRHEREEEEEMMKKRKIRPFGFFRDWFEKFRGQLMYRLVQKKVCHFFDLQKTVSVEYVPGVDQMDAVEDLFFGELKDFCVTARQNFGGSYWHKIPPYTQEVLIQEAMEEAGVDRELRNDEEWRSMMAEEIQKQLESATPCEPAKGTIACIK